MVALPAGLAPFDPVLLPRTATLHDAFHRTSDRPTVTGCGQNLAELGTEAVDVALGMGCLPCEACWPTPAPPIYPGGPRLRRAAPWPGNRAGRRSQFDTVRFPRPAIPAA
ncbi:hypothetical protein OOJ91_11945 [Micromonospora lupini]|nr:hypothetical protein [Micromonospora lupini]